jgi:septal ring factor EnvC (AmiA/AmiB activator)
LAKKGNKMVNPNGLENIIDLCVKTAIAIGVSVAGYHVKNINDDIRTQQNNIMSHTAELAQLQQTVQQTEKWLTRIDAKLDRLVELKK